MKKRWDILGFGNSAVDELIFLEHYPAPECKMPVQRMLRQGGGLCATALVAAARQGAVTGYCCKIGYDELSTFSIEELEREGVDCSPCLRTTDGIPYHAFILIDQLENTRTILFEPGRVEPPIEHISAEMVAGARVLFIDHHAPVAGVYAASIAHRFQTPVIADIETTEIPNLSEFLAAADHLIIGKSFASQITGENSPETMVTRLSSADRACIVVTAGSDGCWYSERGREEVHLPAFSVPVVDTTGCGDVFHGSYAAAIARGDSIPRAIQIASASAAMKATVPGGRSGIPGMSAVEHFLSGRQ